MAENINKAAESQELKRLAAICISELSKMLKISLFQWDMM